MSETCGWKRRFLKVGGTFREGSGWVDERVRVNVGIGFFFF